MGRAKLKMEFIANEKSRILSLKKRKEGLIKKLHQLTTLCDVPACMIIHDPTTNSTSIWPEEDSDHVRLLIDAYNAKRKDPCGVKLYGLSEFFNERQRHAEEELEKLRKKNVESKFSTWDDRLGLMDESQLRGLAAALRGKAEAVRSRIEFLKREAEAMDMMMMKNDAMLFNYPNLGQFYDFDQDIMSADAVMMDAMMAAGSSVPVPNYYCPPPLPMPNYYCPPPQPLMLPPNMDVNQNGAGDDWTRYLCQ